MQDGCEVCKVGEVAIPLKQGLIFNAESLGSHTR